MKLHKGNLFWPPNTEDISLEIHNNFEPNTDVLVVGSGMSGALLKDKKIKEYRKLK